MNICSPKFNNKHAIDFFAFPFGGWGEFHNFETRVFLSI